MTVEEILKAPIMMPLNQYQQQTPQLEVTDHGDPSVGIFSGTYKVDVPLSAPFDKEELEFFKAAIIELYQEFSFGRVTAEYNFEEQ